MLSGAFCAHQRRHISGVSVHFISAAGLGRTAVATTVMGNDPIAFKEEEHHLGVPIVGAQRPAVIEEGGLRAFRRPVLVIDLDAVLYADEAALDAIGERRRRCFFYLRGQAGA